MQETPVAHPGIQEEEYRTLGHKTLLIFILSRIHAATVFLLLTIGIFILGMQTSKTQGLFSNLPVKNVSMYLGVAMEASAALFVLSFIIAFLVSWLIYINYKFSLGEDSLKIKRGILNKEEIAIPYRQIQDVDIERDLSFQLFGLSRIVILTAGHDDDKPDGDDESEGILPALDKNLAEWLQSELLRRANVQKVVETK